ncbi:MAG TPA: hypothetical protein VM733_13880 [Thermoanaerobaculia bacterium]|nr:hypothetical protein [Thermoanaerobaculia bacterium]
MRSLFLSIFLAAAAGAQQAPLTCPPAPAGRPCESFHYHVAMFRPDPRGFAEIAATTDYATQAACERARELAVAANGTVVAAMRVKDQKFEADKFGPCHCDMTALTADQRALQLRTAEDIRLRVRERLLDIRTAPDAEAMRALYSEPPLSTALTMPKIAPLPSSAPAPLVTSADDLKPSKTFDTTKPTIAALDLPLVDIAPAVAQAATTPVIPPPAPPTTTTTPAPEPVVEQTVTAEPEPETSAPPEEAEAQDSAEQAAERFISYETERIQNVLRASASITDETVKTKIFEACMQRIQLLSNLRLLIEGSGSRSALAAAARDAVSEQARLALVSKLFGEKVKPHWAPRDAADVVFDVEPAIAAAPESALRDSTGRVSTEQKKRALYLVLAQTQPTEDQRLWLSTLMEGFLR